MDVDVRKGRVEWAGVRGSVVLFAPDRDTLVRWWRKHDNITRDVCGKGKKDAGDRTATRPDPQPQNRPPAHNATNNQPTTPTPKQGKSFLLGLRVGSRLMVRTAMRLGFGVKPEIHYTVGERAQVAGVRAVRWWGCRSCWGCCVCVARWGRSIQPGPPTNQFVHVHRPPNDSPSLPLSGLPTYPTLPH